MASMLCTQNPQTPHTYCVQITRNACTRTAYNIGHTHTALTARKTRTRLSYPQPIRTCILHRHIVRAQNQHAGQDAWTTLTPALVDSPHSSRVHTRAQACTHRGHRLPLQPLPTLPATREEGACSDRRLLRGWGGGRTPTTWHDAADY